MMSFQEFMGKALQGRRTGGPGRIQKDRRATRPSLEAFEERLLLSGMDLDPLGTAAIAPIQATSRAHLSEVWGTIHGKKADLKAKLTADDGSPIAGQTINFRLGSNFVGSAKTNAEGVATLKNVKLGNLKIRNYIARTIAVLPASSGFPRTVSRGPLALTRPTPTLTPTSIDSVGAGGTYGGSAFYTATLWTSNNTPVSGKAISFLVGNQVIGTATTDASGVAIFRGTSPSDLNAGSYALSAKFAGDSGDAASSGAGTLNIAKATATVTVNGPTTTYNGQQVTASAVTLPAALPVVYSYTDAGGHSVSTPTDAGTYQVTASINDPNYAGSATGSMTIARATVGISGLTVSDKVYDGTTTAVINTAGATLSGVVAGDSVAIDTSVATAAFASKDVGTNQMATIHGLALSGAGAGNYTLDSTSVTTTASILPKSIDVVGILAEGKVYDGTTTVAIDSEGAALSGVVAGDTVGLSTASIFGAFLTKSAGANKAVGLGGLSLTGADAANYLLSTPTTTATILPRIVSVTGITAQSRTYDGTTTTQLNTGGAVVTGLINSDSVSVDPSASTGTFSDKNVGGNKVVTINGLVLTGADAVNYVPLGTQTTLADITPAPLTITGITADKVYDGTVVATLDNSSATLVGAIIGDDVIADISAVTASFGDKNSGTGKGVDYSGLALAGADAGNYDLTLPTIFGDITPKTLTLISPVFASNKAYDGSTSAGVSLLPPVADGVLPGDTAWIDPVSTLMATGTFSDKNVGTGKTVTINGLILMGDDAANYTLAPVTTTANISAKSVVVVGVTAQDKVYDGTTAATIDTGGAVLTGVVLGDDVTMSVADAVGNFEAKDAQGYSLYVWVTGVTLGGADAGNYNLIPVESYAYINKKALTVSGITAQDKVYDSTTAATIDVTNALLDGSMVIPGEIVTLDALMATGAFVDKNVGDGKSIDVSGLILNGADASNYSVSAIGVTATVTPATLSVGGFHTLSKVYDGTTTAPIAPYWPFFFGILGGDSVGFGTYSGASFLDKNVGNNKTAVLEDVTAVGSDAGNYVIIPTLEETANITPATITVVGITAADKTYDGTANATIDASAAVLLGVLGTDAVTLDTTAAAGHFGGKNVGSNLIVTITGLAYSGADVGNYTILVNAPTATISPKAVTITGLNITSKVYDGTASASMPLGVGGVLSGAVLGDDVSIDQPWTAISGTATFADKNAGVGKAVTVTDAKLGGADAGNYTIESATGTGDIAKAIVTLAGVTANKVYDGTIAATLDLGSATFTGQIGPEDVNFSMASVIAEFADKNVGLNKAVTASGFVLTGADAGNYTLAVSPIYGNISARVLHLNGFTATDRTYDGTTGVAIDGSAVTVGAGDIIDNDDVALDLSSLAWATGDMADKNAGNGKLVTISGLALMGFDSGNYVIEATTTVNIAKATLTVTGIPNLTKAYDGNQYFVAIDTSSAAISGIIGSDVVSLNAAGVFGVSTSENVGTWNVFINGLALGGTDAGNYNMGTVIVSGTITGP